MARGDADYLEYKRTRTEHPPPVLHKYTSAEVARLILSTGKIRFQSPLRYNDPFDSQWDPMWNLRTPEAREFQKQLLTKAIEDPDSMPEEMDPVFRIALHKEIGRIYALPLQIRNDEILAFVDDATDREDLDEKRLPDLPDIRRRLRVFCLSAKPQMVTMWSHYADQHRGVVLTFNTNKLEDGFKRPVIKVQYEDSPPTIVDMETYCRALIFGLACPDLPEDPNPWTRTKSPEWEYEDEWRLVLIASKGTLGDYQDYEIPRRSLVEITLGCRTSQEVAKELIALAQPFGQQVKLSQLYMPLGSFRLAKREFLFSDIL